MASSPNGSNGPPSGEPDKQSESMRYRLFIYKPGGKKTVAHTLESDSPFLAINKGDLLNPRCWGEQASTNLAEDKAQFRYGIMLQVTGLEHFIVESDGKVVSHGMGVFTEALEDIAESRP
jgi:hypothetical protein